MMTHYPKIIRDIGTLKNFSCEKMNHFTKLVKIMQKWLSIELMRY